MSNKYKPFFKLFANCIPVKGAARSIICDVQRNTYETIPNSMCELLMEYKNISIEKIKEDFGEENEHIIDEYFQFLLDRDLGFWCSNPDEFPDLNTIWEYPAWITNAIIDVGRDSNHDFNKIFSELDDLGCKDIQIRCYDNISKQQLQEMLEFTQNRRLQSIELYLKYDPGFFTETEFIDLFDKYLRISFLYIHSSPENKSIDIKESYSKLVYIKQKIESHMHCGVVHPAYFNTNQPDFIEALNYNSCLNRKISVDINGNIRNCPSLPASYGNIATTSLHSALAQQGFKDLWEINKDQVEICKDCEFRYICTDCRAFIQNPNDKYSKPAKCGYDPYTATWKND